MKKIWTFPVAAAVLLFAVPLNAVAVSLEECLTRAKENYPLIRQYELVEKLEKFSFVNATSAWLPQVQFLGQATWQTDVAEFPEAMENLYKTVGLDMKGLSKDQYKLMLQISQTIWDGGAARARKNDAKAESEVSRLNIEKEMEDVKSRTTEVYFGILALQENVRTIVNSQKLLEANLSVAVTGAENGTVMQSDIDRIRVELLSLEQKLTETGKALEAYRLVLSLMTGLEIGENEDFVIPGIPEVRTDVNASPALRLFDARSEQIRVRKAMVNTAVMPHFDLFAQGWYGRPGLNMFNDMMYNEFSWNAIVGVRMQWNISSFYTRRNGIRTADSQAMTLQNSRAAYLWNFSLQQTQIEKEIEKMELMQESDREIVSLRRSIRESSESKFRNGVITAGELLRDITEENNAESRCNIHRLDALRNIYKLKNMLGQ